MELAEKQSKIERLRKQIASCQRCALHETRTHTVPGEGNVDANIMLIGEAPGRTEDLKGEPFVGRAGAVLDKLLESISLKRGDIYICNILKCRPPQNRNPLAHEIKACVGSLDIQMRVVNPDVIATLGTFASTYIFEKFSLPVKNISSLAGRVFNVETSFGNKSIVPLFHPAVATYNPSKIDVLLHHFQALKPFAEAGRPKVGEKLTSEKAAGKEDQIVIF